MYYTVRAENKFVLKPFTEVMVQTNLVTDQERVESREKVLTQSRHTEIPTETLSVRRSTVVKTGIERE